MKNRITFLIPSMSGGGAEKVTLLLGNELANRNYEVTFLMTNPGGPFFHLIDSRIKIATLPNKKISRNILAIKKYLNENAIDIFYSSMNYVNVIAGISYKLSNSEAKLILSDHNDINEVLKNSKHLKLFLDFGVRKTYKDADIVMCVSKGVEKSLIDRYQLKNTHVIYNPIEQFQSSTDQTSDNDGFNILTIGRLSNQKNHLLLLRSFKKVINHYPKNKIHLTILGEGDLRQELEDYIEKNNLIENVSMPGFKPIQEYLTQSDLFVLSSDREGFGNVIVEALSNGLPVISTDCPSGPAEILENGKYGILVPVGNVNEMANAIINEIENQNKSIDLINKRKARANIFSVETIVDEYENLFQNILNLK